MIRIRKDTHRQMFIITTLGNDAPYDFTSEGGAIFFYCHMVIVMKNIKQLEIAEESNVKLRRAKLRSVKR